MKNNAVIVKSVESYEWTCPNCGIVHITRKGDKLSCEGCWEHFEVRYCE